MIKFFRHIRQRLIKEHKVSKYLLYAIGEIILVVIGILIALQLNTQKENNEKKEVGITFLTEMRTEVQSDLFALDGRIRRLQRNIENHEAALRTKDIAALPMDSVAMILRPENLDFEISELTFNKMKNLGLSSLTTNDALNAQISTYYNADVVSLKLSMDYVFEELRKYLDYFFYQQDEIDYNFFYEGFEQFEFPALYTQSDERLRNETRINSIQFITSNKGRMLVLFDLDNKRYSLRVLNRFKSATQNLLEEINEEVKSYNPQIEPLSELPTDADFKEIIVAPSILKEYVGTYRSEADNEFKILEEESYLFLHFKNRRGEAMIPTAKDRFFIDNFFAVIQVNRKEGNIISIVLNYKGKLIDYLKIE
jgi:hypothetical protein